MRRLALVTLLAAIVTVPAAAQESPHRNHSRRVPRHGARGRPGRSLDRLASVVSRRLLSPHPRAWREDDQDGQLRGDLQPVIPRPPARPRPRDLDRRRRGDLRHDEKPMRRCTRTPGLAPARAEAPPRLPRLRAPASSATVQSQRPGRRGRCRAACGRRRDPPVAEWRIRGTYLEFCNCDPGCGCNFRGLRDSLEGNCQAVISHVIEEGSPDGRPRRRQGLVGALVAGPDPRQGRPRRTHTSTRPTSSTRRCPGSGAGRRARALRDLQLDRWTNRPRSSAPRSTSRSTESAHA